MLRHTAQKQASAPRSQLPYWMSTEQQTFHSAEEHSVILGRPDSDELQ